MCPSAAVAALPSSRKRKGKSWLVMSTLVAPDGIVRPVGGETPAKQAGRRGWTRSSQGVIGGGARSRRRAQCGKRREALSSATHLSSAILRRIRCRATSASTLCSSSSALLKAGPRQTLGLVTGCLVAARWLFVVVSKWVRSGRRRDAGAAWIVNSVCHSVASSEANLAQKLCAGYAVGLRRSRHH